MEINSKPKLKEIIQIEKNLYYHNDDRNPIERLELTFIRDTDYYYIQKFLGLLRKCEWLSYSKRGLHIFRKLRYYLLLRKKNAIGTKLGFSINENVLGEGVIICHPNVIINPLTKVGNYCIFHGNNCLGNKGFCDDTRAPIIGNNVEIGFGAVILGGVTIADGIKIGANAVVTKSFLQPGIVLAGNPAKRIK